MKKLILLTLSFLLIVPLSTVAEDITEEAVNQHNSYRGELFNTAHFPLTWDNTLAADATAWAKYLAENYSYSDKVKSPHASSFRKGYHTLGKNDQGENIAWGNPGTDIIKAIDLWGAEEDNYHHDTFTCEPGKVCGHYTQIIWQNTSKVGCGVAESTTDYGGEWVVCRYEGPGNYVGQDPYVKDIEYVEEITADEDTDLVSEDQDTQTPISTNGSRGPLTNKDYQIYKKVNLRQNDVENKIRNGKKIVAQIKEIFRKLRAKRDIATIDAIKQKTGDLLTKLREKETLTSKEETIMILVEYLFYRSHVEGEELR